MTFSVRWKKIHFKHKGCWACKADLDHESNGLFENVSKVGFNSQNLGSGA